MRVAVVGVSHWHSAMYIPALQDIGADIVALSDPDRGALERAAVDCARFTDHRELLDSAKPDFVFAHAPHYQMTAVAADLVAAGQPFAMEKPMGVNWRELKPVADEAERQGLFVAVALVTRYLALIEKLAELRDAGELGLPVHYYSRLFAGAPQRYREMHVDWMLDPQKAGAGPLFNFGPHVIDIYLYLTDDPIETVAAFTASGLHGEKIEDLASVTFRGASGGLGVVEISYTHPDDYERYFSLTTDALHVGGNIEGDTIRFRDGRLLEVEPDAAALDTYALYTRDTLERCAEGRPPKASISDMVPVLRVMNAAQRSIEVGAPVGVADVT
jgi:predicted dehydrogenase